MRRTKLDMACDIAQRRYLYGPKEYVWHMAKMFQYIKELMREPKGVVRNLWDDEIGSLGD